MTLENLNQFTGTEQWYRHPLCRRYTYTDGVKYVAEEGSAYWLIDDILIHTSCTKKLKDQDFLVWKLIRNEEGNGAKLICEDGDYNRLFCTESEFTDFPLKSIEFYLINNILLLPSEY